MGSCGGGDDRDAPELLDSAFRKPIRSADLKLEAELSLRGAGQPERPLRIEASGPFRAGGRRLPSADFDLSIGTVGGQTVETGFVSTGGRVFVEFQGVFYEQPRREVARANRELRRGDRRRTLLELSGLDARRWLDGAEKRGETEVAGVETTHLSGRLDVERVVTDLNRLVRRSRAALAGATGTPAPEPLTRDQIERVADVVRDPTFDVYVGKDDDIVRRVVGRLDFSVPDSERDQLADLEGGSLRFSVELADVNGEQRIEAPAKARPLADLTRTLGATGLGGGGSGPSTGAAPPAATTGPDADAYGRYADCLDRSRPDDTDALQRCAELLR